MGGSRKVSDVCLVTGSPLLSLSSPLYLLSGQWSWGLWTGWQPLTNDVVLPDTVGAELFP